MRQPILIPSLAVGFLLSLISLCGWAQSGADPAVTSRNLEPNPLAGVGSTFTLTFRIGNNGTAPITGAGQNNIERMQFGICLAKCSPSPASPAALSGPLLDYFDVVYNADNNCFEGRQKQNVIINPTAVYSLSIAAIVTSASTDPLINDIGASCNIVPNGSASPQPSDNDFGSIYTHTTTGPLPVGLVAFEVQAQAGMGVVVSWQTSWERANRGYVIERSRDLVGFEEVGRVGDLAVTTTHSSRYEYVDPSPYRGRSYYRLRQLEMDGTSQSYPAKWVELAGRYGVYPNPVVGTRFTLELDEPGGAQVHLYDSRGVGIPLRRSILGEQSATVNLETALPSGVYVLTVNERGYIRQHRLVIP